MMFKRCLILFLLSIGQLSAETTVTIKEPMKKTLSYKQKVLLGSVVVASDIGVTIVIVKTILDCFFSKNIGVKAKAMRLIAALSASAVLSMIENKIFERYPDFFIPSQASETKQENVPC